MSDKSDVPCCPKCGSELDIANHSMIPREDSLACQVGCPKCGVWCESYTKADALNMFLRHWGTSE